MPESSGNVPSIRHWMKVTFLEDTFPLAKFFSLRACTKPFIWITRSIFPKRIYIQINIDRSHRLFNYRMSIFSSVKRINRSNSIHVNTYYTSPRATKDDLLYLNDIIKIYVSSLVRWAMLPTKRYLEKALNVCLMSFRLLFNIKFYVYGFKRIPCFKNIKRHNRCKLGWTNNNQLLNTFVYQIRIWKCLFRLFAWW